MLNKRLPVSFGLFCAFVSLHGQPALAQSDVIMLGRTSDNLTTQFSRIERVLANQYPDLFRQPLSVENVIRQLRQLGLPVVLGQSARDDSLDYGEILSLPLPNEPLGVRLRHALGERHATLTITDGLLRIISTDDADNDYRYLMTLVYDVTSLGGTPQALIETIRTTVQSEEWLDTGSGIGAISAIRVGQRNLLIVSQSYNVHRQVRRLLSDLHSAGGTETGGLPRTYRKRGLAKPVVLPETQASDRDVIRVTGLPKKQPPRHENKLGESGGVF